MVDLLNALLYAGRTLDPYAIPFIWAFRVVAACAGTFILLDFFKYRRREQEIPPYNRAANSRAWACASAGAIIGGLGFNALDVYWLSTYDAESPNVVVATVWFAWAAGLTQRASSRAEQPALIWSAAAIITVGGLLVISLGGRVP